MVRAELKVVGGKQHGSLIPLQTKKFLVGREQDCQLRPTSESVSRHHCVFTLDDFSIRLRDLGSTNGTFVNGQRVQGQVVLQPDDRILIGKLEFEIVIQGAVAPVQYARVAASVGSESNAGFLLTDLAESPDAAASNETISEVGSTKILGSISDDKSDGTKVMSADNTSIIPARVPATETVTDLDQLPVMTNEPDSAVLSQPIAPDQPVAPAAPMQAMPMPGMPMPGMPMQGMPGQPMPMAPYGMPGGYPQQQFIQAPFASFTPQYMQNPYGMPQQYMPQQQMDPNFAYQQQQYAQQQFAQQQFAQQQAMLAAQAQNAAQAQYATEPLLDEPEPKASNLGDVVLPTKLPPPGETGVKLPPPAPPPPPAAPVAEGESPVAPPAPEAKPNQLAADIIKKYMNRR